MNEETTNIQTEAKSGGTGALIGAIIIIVLLVIGGWYFIGNRIEKIQEQKANTPVGDITTGDSTEIEDIEQDIKNLNIDALEQ